MKVFFWLMVLEVPVYNQLALLLWAWVEAVYLWRSASGQIAEREREGQREVGRERE
jgi:hypothetical protein